MRQVAQGSQVQHYGLNMTITLKKHCIKDLLLLYVYQNKNSVFKYIAVKNIIIFSNLNQIKHDSFSSD
jgi:hypothetical protein